MYSYPEKGSFKARVMAPWIFWFFLLFDIIQPEQEPDSNH